jgi:hypothetical protein
MKVARPASSALGGNSVSRQPAALIFAPKAG